MAAWGGKKPGGTGNTCSSRGNKIYCQEVFIIHPLISELIHPDIMEVGVCGTLLAQQNVGLCDPGIVSLHFSLSFARPVCSKCQARPGRLLSAAAFGFVWAARFRLYRCTELCTGRGKGPGGGVGGEEAS